MPSASMSSAGSGRYHTGRRRPPAMTFDGPPPRRLLDASSIHRVTITPSLHGSQPPQDGQRNPNSCGLPVRSDSRRGFLPTERAKVKFSWSTVSRKSVDNGKSNKRWHGLWCGMCISRTQVPLDGTTLLRLCPGRCTRASRSLA